MCMLGPIRVCSVEPPSSQQHKPATNITSYSGQDLAFLKAGKQASQSL